MSLTRLLQARQIVVVGGGAWCESIIGAARRIGFTGVIVPVHPSGKQIAGLASVPSVADVDGRIDAAFIGVNRKATVQVVRELAALGSGGAVCFASGFSEADAEDSEGRDLQAALVEVAGDMPILGPNCYGFINALDRVAIWPDQHGMAPVERGVAILTQSSNIAINMTMQKRGLPIAYVVACGNQAQTSQADVAMSLLDDPRVTALGLHIEGFGDTAAWHKVALMAWDRGVGIVAIKVGASDQARSGAVSHSASLAGSDAGADALLRRFGMGRVGDVPTFLETLKLLHMEGRLDAPTLSSISCSGGEALLCADTVAASELTLPALDDDQKQALRAALGPMVALANPLDYHTYIWRDVDAMTAAWRPMAADNIGLTLAIVDYPHTDAADWECATQAAIRVRAETGRPVAVVATLPELMPEDISARLMAHGVVPIQGLREAISAAQIASCRTRPSESAPLTGHDMAAGQTMTETEAKFALSAHDLDLPRRIETDLDGLATDAQGLTGPLVLKGVGLAHKSEAGAVKLGLTPEELEAAAIQMPADRFLVEEMIENAVAELLIGVTMDPAHGMVLTLAAGGVLTELLEDRTSLVLPVTEREVEQALTKLKLAKLLDGFRGKPAASRPAIISAVMAVQDYVLKNHPSVIEIEINPLICTPTRAVAVDALITKG
ncbi:CoA-binding protein [Aliishimia ponticola]|uniref:CoA-binding protein n=2 Tax=Aliishimia ponticola TaxID=2499833 RepID=A0A4S4N6W5_9RHOB|nr:CoA-binding protein [Aliishimia ponticola]